MSSAAGTGTGGRRKAPLPPARRSSQQGYDELKLKFLTADRNYENLKQLAKKGKTWLDRVISKRSLDYRCFDVAINHQACQIQEFARVSMNS